MNNSQTNCVDFLVFSADGNPAPGLGLSDAMTIDLEFMPAFAHKPRTRDGVVTLPVADFPFAVSIRMPVPGFGHVWLYADDEGRGYTAADTSGKILNFCLEAAASRVSAVERTRQKYEHESTRLSSDYVERMANAQNLLADARAKQSDHAACARLALQSLAHSMHAGEMLVIEHARARIEQTRPRKGFLFGCNAFRGTQLGEPYRELFRELLNFGTLPFYRKGTEKEQGNPDFSGVEKLLDWTERDRLQVKGHPLVWFHRGAIPDWLYGCSYEEVRDSYRTYIRTSVGHFKDRIKTWDVINEAHDWANEFQYDFEQLVDITRMACEATREANPDAVRVVNSCCTWSEYVARSETDNQPLNRPGRNVLRYVRDVIAAGVDFEVIGLQMYYPTRDLFEINRHLDMFCELGKPVHITELGVSASPEKVDAKPGGQQVNPHYWHGRPWSESEQADWIEGYYTICYAKPAVEAVSWWDFCDPAFIPHAGLCNRELKPREGYHRLKALLQKWEVISNQ